MDQSVSENNLEMDSNVGNSLREGAAFGAAERASLKQKCLELEEKQKRKK